MPHPPSRVPLNRRFAVASAALSLLIGLAATAPATAPATRPALSDADLQALHQLELGTWRQRVSAQDALAARGVADEPIIAGMLARTTNPEARTRLHAVLLQMENDRQIGASRITLHYKNAPVKTVYADLFHQAWAPLNPTPANLLDTLPPVSIDADRKPFWTVMQQLSNATGLGMDRPLGAYLLCHGNAVEPGPQIISGGFLVVLRGTRRFVRLNNAGLDKCFWVDLAIYPEPKLDVLAMEPRFDLAPTLDDHGNALEFLPQQPNLQNNVPPGGYTVSLGMIIPKKNPGSRLARLQATLHASVGLQSARFDISDLTAAKPQTLIVDGLALKFDGCKKNNGQFEVSFSTPPDPQYRFQQILQSTGRLRVIDADGHAMQCFQSLAFNNPTAGCRLTYSYRTQPGDSEPRRLVWEIPTVIKSVDIPVDFRGLNLDFIRGGEGSVAPDQADEQNVPERG